MSLTSQILSGDTRAVARAISIVEREGSESGRLIGLLHAHTGRARIVGVTGPPGVGKSCLVDRLARLWRDAQFSVAVLAVDPTSPFTGGALLGDRIRMNRHTLDPGVFFRSMATRGHLGGLAPTTHDAVSILDAAGFDIVVIETVGVGQGEIDISRTAHISVVVVAPGAGDDVQAIKAGVMEIADVFVVNKSDRDGADRTASEIEAMLALGSSKSNLELPAVIKTSVLNGDGINKLEVSLSDLVKRVGSDDARSRARARARARARVEEILRRRIGIALAETTVLEEALDRIVSREVDPYTAAESVAKIIFGSHL
ncbi:MAG: methylmalonyl Co-A mutase-associated GTPase MeaB [Acidobacteriota bacterium]|nr:methylmalonyl Co-A mutase-associated GTPase MeaB [Acidobacteriota bacterium]